jgi:putative colanic acid biosynthesis UDP-glucose lipid carrier transferase
LILQGLFSLNNIVPEENDFICYKFCTTQVNKDADAVQATKGDSRVTRIVPLCARNNELPQFL